MLHNSSRLDRLITSWESKVRGIPWNFITLDMNISSADGTTGEKRYIPNFNLEQVDQKLNVILTSSCEWWSICHHWFDSLDALNTLNKSTTKPKRMVAAGRQNSITSSSTNAPQGKGKRTGNRKWNESDSSLSSLKLNVRSSRERLSVQILLNKFDDGKVLFTSDIFARIALEKRGKEQAFVPFSGKCEDAKAKERTKSSWERKTRQLMWTSITRKDITSSKGENLIKEHSNESMDDNNRERSHSTEIPIDEVDAGPSVSCILLNWSV